MTTNAIAYYQVSTPKQGQSGLGLEVQQAAVVAYAAAHRLTPVSSGEFTEIETGTNKRQRPKLQAAIVAAKAHDAVLLIAKLDRLARNVHFITGLQESGAKFVAVDMPEANELTVQIMAVMAQHEAKMISERTKDCLGSREGVRCETWQPRQPDRPGAASGPGRQQRTGAASVSKVKRVYPDDA